MAEFDMNEFTLRHVEHDILQLGRTVNARFERRMEELLKRAYVAGAEMAYDDTCGCISDPRDRGFEEFLRDLKARL